MDKIMQTIFSFITIIIIGLVLKKKGILQAKDTHFMSKIIMNLTLPCALISSSKGIQINGYTLMLICFAILANIAIFYLCVFFNKKENKLSIAVMAMNASGFNIGNFAIPVVQAFFNSNALGYILMFDIGNSICGFGLMYYLASNYINANDNFDIKELKEKVFKSVPFITYLLIVFAALVHFQLPVFLLNVTSTIGEANIFLSMLYIGLLIDFRFDYSVVYQVFKIMRIRLFGEMVLAVAVCILPISILIKIALLFCLFTPTTSLTPIYCKKLGSDSSVSAICSTISMIVSILIYMILLFWTGGLV
ncbi:MULTISPECIES: AEC family transporter [Faecalicoccus]|uniref:Permease n=1 Tax=Faecalicoccus pleomorphus TaxID=1323 RepID=A0AAW6CSZ5_9FIRM|nr:MULTISPECIES: AEC family transporter [Faecalicoccus]MDB7980148.1 hypothetical protein [Faecalicoccus pleomorphus]MDB7982446.1 hypothetical protein [Faecalicoccus pleomorphus]MDB7987715.1 hypothetical protein [Faecalicoccus pleomorphus]MDB7992240.1 hypothetical protein [Faecalicoccus pleomorphus]MDY4278750.1 hypothetical protein [Faecalicoccus sp.]